MLLRSGIYLDRDRSGLSWLLDPASDHLRQLVAKNNAESASSAADYKAHLADADLLRRLLMERHPACLLGTVSTAAIDKVLTSWTSRLDELQPRTRQGCVGSLGYDLGKVLGDAHLRLLFEQRPLQEQQALEARDGPAWRSWTHHGVRVVRIRSLDSTRDSDELEAGVAGAPDDFDHRQIVVDLRGNTGGDDGYVLRWMRDFIPQSARLHAPSFELRVQDTQLNRWNLVALFDLLGEQLPASFRTTVHRPDPTDVLEHTMVDDGSVSVGSSPWRGAMMIVIDGRSGSSAESATLMLQRAFGARIVGVASFGSIDYGNVCPYLLPDSGMQIQIPTRANNWPRRIDFTGIRPDVSLDVQQPATRLAERFPELVA